MTVILGIETSCDETAAAIVVDGRDVRSSVVSSQIDLHVPYGGVVPEIAGRAHVQRLNPVHVVIGGIVGAALFVVAIVMLVSWVVKSGVAT